MIVCPECAGTVGAHLRGCVCAQWERLVAEHLEGLDQLDAELADQPCGCPRIEGTPGHFIECELADLSG